MSKYKPLTAPITRQEACSIIDRKRFDTAVRLGSISSIGKGGEAGRTSPLLFDQASVRKYAKYIADDLANEAKQLGAAATAIAKRQPPLTRRQIAAHIGKRQTGILIRGGTLVPNGTITDTQTAAHTYDPTEVADALNALADKIAAESKTTRNSAKTRIPA